MGIKRLSIGLVVIFNLQYAAATSFAAELPPEPTDPFGYLEEVLSPQSLDWVNRENARTSKAFAEGADFENLQSRIRTRYESPDRLINPAFDHDGYSFNLWQDQDHRRGIWRRISYQDFVASNGRWETVLDLDELAAKDQIAWAFHGAVTQSWEGGSRALLRLSPDGGDGTVIKEFDLKTRTFVEGGFEIAAAENEVLWLNQDEILVASSLTGKSKSNYPLQIRLWHRGQKLQDAPVLLQGKQDEMAVQVASNDYRGRLKNYFLVRVIDFYHREVTAVYPDGRSVLLPIPASAEPNFDVMDGRYFNFALKEDWSTGGKVYPQGSLLSLDLEDLKAPPHSLFDPTGTNLFYAGSQSTRNKLYLTVTRDVQSEVIEFDRQGLNLEVVGTLPLPSLGKASVIVRDAQYSDDIFVRFESFLQSPTLYRYDGKTGLQKVSQQKTEFDTSYLVAEQRWVKSKDGTRVPYFLIHPKNQKGPVSTILYGYGGFDVSMDPVFFGGGWIGEEWLSGGRAYALANIRGGGEFGPAWHQAAKLKNRQKAYDDFIAIAEDLNSSQISTPAKLGIMGGSNGGLLTGAVTVQRPDLFGAVISQVPLLDMLRYTHLSKGSSWAPEYGDPDDPVMREVISKYSPYQNIPPNNSRAPSVMPEILFATTRSDDRVHPSHARKMTARMQSLGYHPFFHESEKGGHGGATDIVERSRMVALNCNFLLKNLGASR